MTREQHRKRFGKWTLQGITSASTAILATLLLVPTCAQAVEPATSAPQEAKDSTASAEVARDSAQHSLLREAPQQVNAQDSTPSDVSVTQANADELLKVLLADDSLAASNVKLTGSPLAAGTFAHGQTTLGIDNGLLFSTGDITGGHSALGTPGDSDLDTILGAPETHDAISLEFDFVPKGSTLSFNYVFGSEEYPDYVGSEYNDTFAFLVNGANVALIPGSNNPVSINTVNANENSGYFIDNSNSAIKPLPGTQFGGLTKVLPVTAPVIKGKTNHIKIVLADANDNIYNSFVAIQKNSMKSLGTVNVHYVDQAGKHLSDDVVLTGNIGDPYTTDKKSFNGYVFQQVQGNEHGTFANQTQEVTYVYSAVPTPVGQSQTSQTNSLADTGTVILPALSLMSLLLTAACGMLVCKRHNS
ncbi:choice-of-anchor L domain-containing protein [Bifidobacterium sp. ESL0798]|uniref:choice-of-anchor L domain-containing protein n=1 Tax=Bifidobacterium sp. ESL0798 TaxID=2983235 RepID=UPI0023F98CE9|nr:choice-of-anchor L domain-containing protein [Bifidobacterium sp. ESL0798]WEV74441.1 choice-of-anchor L domain-containing protein [Bifidobacterium sp. ESL0798]